jgi:hypothetical protein
MTNFSTRQVGKNLTGLLFFRRFMDEYYARIEGTIFTVRKNSKNIFNVLSNTFYGHNFVDK